LAAADFAVAAGLTAAVFRAVAVAGLVDVIGLAALADVVAVGVFCGVAVFRGAVGRGVAARRVAVFATAARAPAVFAATGAAGVDGPAAADAEGPDVDRGVRRAAGFAVLAGVRVRRRRLVGGVAATDGVTIGGLVLTGDTASTAWIAAVPTARAAPAVALAADPAADAARLASLPASAATSLAASPACFERLATCFCPFVPWAVASWRSRLASIARAASRRPSSFRISLAAAFDNGPAAPFAPPTRSVTASTRASLLTVRFVDRPRSLAIDRLQLRCSPSSL
jgi:hypothetical protein